MIREKRPPRSLAALLALWVVAAGACTDDPMAPTIGQAPRIVLDREAVLSESHEEVITFDARVLDANGQEVDVPLEWTSNNPGVLESLGDGSFRTRDNGTAEVTVRVPRTHPSVAPGGYYANIPDAEALVQVEQTARRWAMYDGGSSGDGSSAVTAIDIWAIDELVALLALPTDDQGQVVETFESTSLTWTSADEAVLRVSQDGTITPVANGTTTLRVSGEGLSGEIQVRVRATQDVRACLRIGTEAQGSPASQICSTLRLTFTRGGGA